jgi:Flp pilus assembly protein TadD
MADLDRAKLARLHDTLLKGGTVPDAAALVAAAGDALRIRAFDQAMALIDAALVAEPEYAPAWALRGATLEQRGDSDGAMEAYRTALAIDDHDPVTSLALASLYAKAGRVDQARSLLAFMILDEDDLPAELRQRAGHLLATLRNKPGVDA